MPLRHGVCSADSALCEIAVVQRAKRLRGQGCILRTEETGEGDSRLLRRLGRLVRPVP